MKTVLSIFSMLFFVLFFSTGVQAQSSGLPIVILIPGTTGTDLITSSQAFNDTSNSVWTDQIFSAVEDSQYTAALNLLESTNLRPGIPGGTYNINVSSGGYGSFAEYFVAHQYTYVNAQWGGVNWGLPSGPINSKLMIGFGYDWREDNSITADSLQSLLRTIYNLYGNSTKIFLVAHSMGGLISRYYLESGMGSSDPWYPQIKALITLATPHLGSPLAFGAIIGNLTELLKLKVPIIGKIIPLAQQFMVNEFNSTYELLPPAQVTFISALEGISIKQYSILDPTLPQNITNGISKAIAYLDSNYSSIKPYLTQANNFFSKLNYNTSSALPPYFCIYANRKPTCKSYYLIPDRDTFGAKDGLGDGIVEESSAKFEGRTVAGLYKTTVDSANHINLPTLPDVQQQAYSWIDSLSTNTGAKK